MADVAEVEVARIEFGALAPPIAKQLKEQFPTAKFRPVSLRMLQKFCDAQALLAIHGFVTESQKRSVQLKLMRTITNVIRLALGGAPLRELRGRSRMGK